MEESFVTAKIKLEIIILGKISAKEWMLLLKILTMKTRIKLK